MEKLFEKIKFVLIEYIHLLILVFIFFSLYINNMPVNFQFDEILESYIPSTFTKEKAISLGIKDPQNSKVYSILSAIYGVIRSFLSPNFKTMLFKLTILFFILGLVFGKKYSWLIFWLTVFISSISLFFWIILYSSELISDKKNSEYYKYIQDNFNNIQSDPWYIATINSSVAIFIISSVLFILRSNLIKNNPALTTFIILLCMFILYFRVDGILYFLKEEVENRIWKYGQEWWGNMSGESSQTDENEDEDINIWNRWILFIIYLVIFFMIIIIKYKPPYQGIKKFSIFNQLIDKTNHPYAILFLYAWFFLYRPKGEYSYGWLILFIILTVIEMLKGN